jgi:tetratricopeptide (TPR) repeat protein
MYSMNGDNKQALKLLSIVTKSDPQYPIGWESTARIAIAAGDWQAADDAIRVLGTFKDQHMTATFLKGQEYAASGKPADAIPLYTQVIGAGPDSPLATHALPALVAVYQSENKLQDAIDAIHSLKLDSPYASTLLGECLVRLGKYEEAATEFDKAIAKKSTAQAPYIGRAELYIKGNEPEQALDILKKANDAAPGDPRALMLTAGIMAKLGRYPDAIALYDQILVHNPDMDSVANNLAQTIADYEYDNPVALERARQIAERFVDSGNPLYLDTIGWIYYRQNNLQQAQIILEKAAGFKNLPPEVHYHYGCLLAKIGKAAEAKAELTQATGQGANYRNVEDARKLLNNL